MKKRVWLILGLFFLWGAGSTYWYVCKIKGFCAPQQKEELVEREISVEEEIPLETPEETKDFVYFEKNSVRPVIEDSLQWKAEVKSIKELQKEGKKLFIYGPYYAWEKTPEGYDNLGMARAESLKRLLSKEIDTSLIRTDSKLLEDRQEGEYISAINGVYQWKTYNDYVKEEMPGTVLIYFPYNSNQEINIKERADYLDELATELKENPDMKIQITGHTDDTGSEASNLKLSQKRADRIKSVLVNKGVRPQQIEILAKGESEPVADNKTEKGRQQNRRVEIKIIK